MNWGNRLLLVFIVFGAGMFFLVYKSMSTNYDLVETDYYKQELRYQQVIDSRAAADSLSAPISFIQTEQVIQMQLPSEMKNQTLTGEVWFYCSYDKKKDKKFNLQANEQASQSFTNISKGDYTVKVRWAQAGKEYYSEKNITVK
ncbi:MAG: FixH family protein [Chitinophagaceae bacterium]|nr:FixH family protein [Chitinophagaceae bacterium]MBK8953033.1 FixH family protein [Chitinophagaceae bacterium]